MAYEINININGDVNELGGVDGEVSGVSKISNTQVEKNQKELAKYISAQTLEPFIQNVKTSISQNIQIVTGNRELQDRVNFGFQAVQSGINAFKNASAGVIVGRAVGMSSLAGGLLGAGLTVLSAGIQKGFDYYQLSLQRRIESYQLKQLQDRQGSAYNRSRS